MVLPILDEAAIFNTARRLEEQARRRYLDMACAEDHHVLARIEALLRVHEQESFLESPVAPTGEHTATVVSNLPDTKIGAYKLVEQIGEGGFGVVFLAEQQHPLRRSVALKILKPGMDSRPVVARFEAERQALALMDHPNIARVLDGGEAASGRPYFVMELVRGVPITRYCDEQQLTPRQRLGLFLAVCGAIQHAHQKGIIHRDLKPTNILVAVCDGQPVAKVIDFGVAKALGERLTERTLVTGLCGIVGTLEYMSPEQAEFNARDIDTRADIYSLGVVLYELLTGTTPLTRERLQQEPTSAVLRAIREEEPPKPSLRLSALKKSLTTISAQRRLEPALLTRMLRGELDWIVMKALDKDRGRRYATANALARDIERYLQDEPVEACPPSAWYRARKFAGKNRKLLGAVTAFALLLAAGIIVSTWLAVRATRAEQTASDNAIRAREALAAESRRRQQTREALDMLSSQVIEEWLFRQKEHLPEHREFLKKAVAAYEELARDTGTDEETRAGVALALQRVGNMRNRLGQTAETETAYRRSGELYQQLAADFPSVPAYRRELARSQNSLGILFSNSGRAREAEDAYREALKLQQQLATDFPSVSAHRSELAGTHNNVGKLLDLAGRTRDAEHAFRAALKLQQQLAAESPTVPEYREFLAHHHDNLASVLLATGRIKDAEHAYREALHLRQQLAADFPTVPGYRQEVARSHNNLGVLLGDTGRARDAETAYGDALKLQRRLAAAFPTVPAYLQDLARTQNNLGNLLQNTGRARDAESALGEAMKIEHHLAADFPAVPSYRQELARSCNSLGLLLQNTSREQDAERAFREAIKLYERLSADFPNMPRSRACLAMSHSNLGNLLGNLGRTQEAETALADAIKHFEQVVAYFPNMHEYRNGLAGAMVNLANVLRQSKRPGRARELLEQAVPHHQAVLQANPGNPKYRQFFRNNRGILAEMLVDLGDHAAAADAAAQFTQTAIDPRGDIYHAACILARCVALAERDTDLSLAQRKEQADAYADRAMDTLRRALQNGYKDAANMKKDSDLDPLRARPDFQRLLAELEATAPATIK
jgi:serine/threonine protein kinase